MHYRLLRYFDSLLSVVGGFQPQDQVIPSAGGHVDPSAGSGFGQSSQSFYSSRGAPRGGPRNNRSMMNGYRGSSNGFRGTTLNMSWMEQLCCFSNRAILPVWSNFIVCYQVVMKDTALRSQTLHPAVVMAKPNLTHRVTIPVTNG